MGGIAYSIESCCSKPVKPPTPEKARNIPDTFYDFTKEIQDFEDALAGLRRAEGEDYRSQTLQPIDSYIPANAENQNLAYREVSL